MDCPLCTTKIIVSDSRHKPEKNTVWRRRRCVKCNHAFTTIESMQESMQINNVLAAVKEIEEILETMSIKMRRVLQKAL